MSSGFRAFNLSFGAINLVGLFHSVSTANVPIAIVNLIGIAAPAFAVAHSYRQEQNKASPSPEAPSA